MSQGFSLLNTLSALFDVTALFDAKTRLFDIEVQDTSPGLFLVEAFRGGEAVDDLGVIEVICLSPDACIDLLPLLGKQARLLISLPDGTRIPRTAYIARAENAGSDGTLSRYRLILAPGLWYAHTAVHSRIYHHKTRLDVVEEILSAYVPKVDWVLSKELQQSSTALPQLDVITQYRESDYDFIRRLLSESNIAFRFAERENALTEPLGQATQQQLILFTASSQQAEDWASAHQLGGKGIRFHRGASQEEQDSITAMFTHRHALSPNLWATQGWPDNKKQSVSSSLEADLPNLNKVPSIEFFQPLGHRLSSAELETRLQQIQQNHALDSQGYVIEGNVRSVLSGSTLRISNASAQGLEQLAAGEVKDRFFVTGHHYVGINNLPTAAKQTIKSMLGELWPTGNKPDAPEQKSKKAKELPPITLTDWNTQRTNLGLKVIDQAPSIALWQILAERARNLGFSHQSSLIPIDLPWSPRPLAKPQISGPVSAFVVGPDGSTSAGDTPIYTDAFGRVKVAFHFQNDDAQANVSAWVRVVQRMAGKGRGMQITPRIGHEVLVSFLLGDPDAPVVTGSLYNGQGEGDETYSPASQSINNGTTNSAQNSDSIFGQSGNLIAAAQGNLMGGNSPVWHGAAAGDANHRHGGAIIGFRSQAFDGQGHNQLVFDDSDGQLQIHLHSTQANSQLNLGHIIHRADNHRGSYRGQGWEIRSDAYGALRAGRGLLISSYGLQHSNKTHEAMGDNAGVLALIKQVKEITKALSDANKQHKGLQVGAITGTSKANSSIVDPKLPPIDALLNSAQGQVSDNNPDKKGSTPAQNHPHTIIAARGGLIATAQEHHYLSGESHSWLAGQHLSIAGAQQARLDAGQALSITGGLDPKAIDNGTGLSLITGEGDLLIQSQSSSITLASKGKLTAESAKADTTLAAAKKIVIKTAGGASITIGDGFTAECSGQLTIHASARQFSGGGNASSELPSFAKSKGVGPGQLNLFHHYANKEPVKGGVFNVTDSSGKVIKGSLDDKGFAHVSGLAAGAVSVKFLKDPRDPLQQANNFKLPQWPEVPPPVAEDQAPKKAAEQTASLIPVDKSKPNPSMAQSVAATLEGARAKAGMLSGLAQKPSLSTLAGKVGDFGLLPQGAGDALQMAKEATAGVEKLKQASTNPTALAGDLAQAISPEAGHTLKSATQLADNGEALKSKLGHKPKI